MPGKETDYMGYTGPVKLSISLSTFLDKRLREEAHLNNQNLTQFVREAIENELDQRKRLRAGADIAEIRPDGKVTILVHSTHLGIINDRDSDLINSGNPNLAEAVESPTHRNLKIPNKPH